METLEKEIKTEDPVYLIRSEVNHFGFATALVNRLQGKPDDVRMKVLISATPIFDKYYPGIGFLWGQAFECCEFLEFINGSYDSEDLKEMKSPEGFTKPTEFTVEVWNHLQDDIYKWRLSETILINGIEWNLANHSSDGGTRCCAGYAQFTYKNRTHTPIVGRIVEIPKTEKYVRSNLKEILKAEIYA